MYSYIIGKIISQNKKTITIETNYIGYIINVVNPMLFEINKIKKIFLYKHTIINNKNSLNEDFYGFINYQEKEFFLRCISISGIGPKTAFSFLKNDLNILRNFIGSKNMDGLEKLENINKKFSYLLVDNLADHYQQNNIESYEHFHDVIGALETIGYNQNEINCAINQMANDNQLINLDLSDLVSYAIKLISKYELKNNKA